MNPVAPHSLRTRLLAQSIASATAWSLGFCLSALFLAGAFALPTSAAAQVPITSEDMRAFTPRPIGPAVTGGRIHDVEALPDDPSTLFVATASGGLWKSTNRGQTWANVWESMPTSTFGDVDISRSNSNVIYAGTGEQQNRQSTSWGNGVYRSDDLGETWRHLGLENTRHIGKVRVHPTDPDVAFVAAQGNLWAASADRGVYRTRDGGATWEKVLFVDENTGATDLVIDPSQPNVVYAALYQRRRRTWGMNGGGPGSGIYKSSDGGDSWQELTNGIPAGDKGRIGLAIAESNPRILNALIEHATESGTYRSEDSGTTWEKVSDQNGRPMYYSHIFIDPQDDRKVYTLATRSFTSDDGGRTFSSISAQETYDVGLHSDHHTMWIDPHDSNHFFLAGDAGLHETYDRGQNYERVNNIDIGQFYGIGVDMKEPYNVYGGMQDNHSWMGPSETTHWAGILNDDWQQIGFGDGMYQAVDPTDSRIVYSSAQNGNYVRFDSETGDMLDIKPQAPMGEDEYRWDWDAPGLASVHTPGTVYLGANRLFISRNRGDSWERTEDLTRAEDREGLELMGVMGRDIAISKNDGTSSYAEITTIGESPLLGSVLWVGTDDGNVQVSRDGGRTWTEVGGNVSGVRNGTYVSRVTPSASGQGAAYVAFDAHRDGDFTPYVFRTEDYGATWQPVMSGLAGSVNDVIEHPDNADVLFAGTEHHLYVSTDRGAHWAQMPNLPTTIYEDLVIHPRDKDLVIGTHGRSIWILDDTRPLAEWAASVGAPVHVFSVEPVRLFKYWKDTSYRAQAEFAGKNPVDGAQITYRLAGADNNATLTITNARGQTVRTYRVPGAAGTHRVNWDLRHAIADTPDRWAAHDDSEFARPVGQRGPMVSPGRYTATLQAGGTEVSQSVVVRNDPALRITDAQHRARETFLLEVRDLIREMGDVPELPSPDRQNVLRAAQRELTQMMNSFVGGGVRQGTLNPPTAQHRARLEAIREVVRGG